MLSTSASKKIRRYPCACRRHARCMRLKNALTQCLRGHTTHTAQTCLDASATTAKRCATWLATHRINAFEESGTHRCTHVHDTRELCGLLRVPGFRRRRKIPKLSRCTTRFAQACARVFHSRDITRKKSAAHWRPIEATLSMDRVSVPRPRSARRNRPARAARRTGSRHRPAARTTSPRPRHRH